MKLATTTGDFRSYSDSLADLVSFYDGTGFRLLDLDLYRSISPGYPFLDAQWERWIDAGGEAAASRGMHFCQAHAPSGDLFGTGEPFDVFLDATIRSIKACGRLSIPAIVVHQQDIGGFPSRENRRLNLQRNRAFFSRLFPVMEKTRVRVLIENSCDRHAPGQENRRNFPSTAAELLELADHIDHPLIGVCWDTGHANIQGLDQYQSLIELSGRLGGVHIADNYGDVDSHVAPYQGTTNMDAVMQGLLDSGFPGPFTFESSNLLRNAKNWPHFRKEWQHGGKPVTLLSDVPLALRRQAVALLYQIGKHFLTAYGCFEEN